MKKRLSSVTVSPSGRYLALGGDDETIKVRSIIRRTSSVEMMEYTTSISSCPRLERDDCPVKAPRTSDRIKVGRKLRGHILASLLEDIKDIEDIEGKERIPNKGLIAIQR